MIEITDNDLLKLTDNSSFLARTEQRTFESTSECVSEILLDDIYLLQVDFSTDVPHSHAINTFSDCVVSQWAVNGRSVCETAGKQYELCTKNSSLYYKSEEPVLFHADAMTNGCHVVLSIPKEKFLHRFYDDNRFLNEFCNNMEKGNPMWAGKSVDITSAMMNIIRDINHVPYSGQLKKLYIESKIQELMVMQIGIFTQEEKPTSLKARDKELIREVKLYLEENPASTKTIVELARMVGINQNKLKQGFKELFNHTVFGFVTDVRMAKAKHLLLEEKMFVNEVADEVGYRYPQHFTAAFKRKYGFLPGELRNQ